MKSKSLLLVGALTILICIVILFVFVPGEPSYQGITLHRWLDIVCPLSGNSLQQQAQGQKAIRPDWGIDPI